MNESRVANIRTIGIVGAGAMGRGIAQIAVLAGVKVLMFDTNSDTVQAAYDQVCLMLDKLTNKGKLDAEHAAIAKSCLCQSNSIAELVDCDLIVEAVVERIKVKQEIFQNLEKVVSEGCILATNTSSLSITEIASACACPARVVGFHFFNPVPLMKVVEVIDGVHTDPAVSNALNAFARRLGHTPVRAKDMPGFIVNHAGRAMNTEGLKILGEGVATCEQVDAIMRQQAGFKLGPFELLDLTALDVSQPVMESIYHQFYEEPRFRPSPIARVRLAGGLLGRKSGRGFYSYEEGRPVVSEDQPAPSMLPRTVWVSDRYPEAAAQVRGLVEGAGIKVDDGQRPEPGSLIVVTPFGSDATTSAVEEGLDATRVIAVDALYPLMQGRRRTLMTTPATHRSARNEAHALFAHDESPVTVINDSTGFVAQRIVALIVNVGCDIAQQNIASPSDIDLAVELGLGYPMGPFELGDHFGPKVILEILNNIQQGLGDPRYRPSPWLARRAMLNIPLRHAERVI
ncbi:3-hydroxyacyl-CoA dehydrogenase [Pseudomonas fluorescens HK44]|uniref:3-hydroxyacyl-CoA dehydrogenase n=1 Tax=Pseudomonas fluorescens HK44 TaxID=1042209 RepID=A0A010SYT3_PSEFL|nr:3-hydroxyacyl-CoA dehydrogenase [Pseudomonas fluorescens]EXF95838.1 3-hydroxyacyl-CoA dehydrogenase [Pseudomonas fluorescens HK44]